jgi:DNA sulfur modification protein DndB
MIRIADNFSDAKSLLKKESKEREKEDLEKDEILENEVWNLFYKLGFTRLNIGRECLVEYGKKESDLQTKKIDVIAESEDVRAYIECTTQENDTPKIKQWISEVDDIRKYENKNPDTTDKNVVFIYCNSQKLNEFDKGRLSKKGIIYLNSSIIEYFLALKAQYSRLAYFQLVSYLCKGQLIRSLTDEELTVPAIRCKYDNKTYCYLFAIQPGRIIPLSTVPHRKLDYEEDLNNNYQRLVKKTKINAIKKFITEQRGVFPTNIIISIENDKTVFQQTGAAINNIHHGTITLPRKFQSLNIIDGQHRLFAYDGLDQGLKDLIYIVAFERMELEKQIKTFIDINEKQTKVSPSLLWDLYPTILGKDEIKYRISTLVKRLNEQEESSLFGLISYDSAPYSNKAPKLTLESVCTAIKTEKITEDVNSSMELLRIPNREDSIAYSILSLWFKAIRESAPEHWNRTDKTLNLLRSNQGFGAMIKLLSKVIREFISNDTFESIRTDDYEVIINEFKDYLAPIINEVEKLKTKEEIKSWKRIGEGGKLIACYQNLADKSLEQYEKLLNIGRY